MCGLSRCCDLLSRILIGSRLGPFRYEVLMTWLSSTEQDIMRRKTYVYIYQRRQILFLSSGSDCWGVQCYSRLSYLAKTTIIHLRISLYCFQLEIILLLNLCITFLVSLLSESILIWQLATLINNMFCLVRSFFSLYIKWNSVLDILICEHFNFLPQKFHTSTSD